MTVYSNKYNIMYIIFTEMYCRVGFADHMYDDPEEELESLELPQIIPANEKSNRKEKTMFHELEVCIIPRLLFVTYLDTCITERRYLSMEN